MPPIGPCVLAINGGSSSLKFGAYGPGGQASGWTGQVEGLQPGGRAVARVGEQPAEAIAVPPGGDAYEAALAWLLGALSQAGAQVRAVAHRIVHGGEAFVAPVVLGDAELRALEALNPLAPLHQPHNLAGVRAFRRALPGVPQVGCFDTAFHAGLPEVERLLPLPAQGLPPGLRRYGFHGLSYQWSWEQLARRSERSATGRVLMMHLGNGSSVCALKGGQVQATSMGFSALDGLMMGTRSGSLDPGVLLHLLEQGWDRERLERLLWRESGLRGVSGLSADMRTLRASEDPAARRAIDLYTHRALRECGAQIAVTGGLDVLVFTGGIGEHDVSLRTALGAGLAYTGLVLDDAANAASDGGKVAAIHRHDSVCEAWVIPCDEGSVAARAAWALLPVGA